MSAGGGGAHSNHPLVTHTLSLLSQTSQRNTFELSELCESFSLGWCASIMGRVQSSLATAAAEQGPSLVRRACFRPAETSSPYTRATCIRGRSGQTAFSPFSAAPCGYHFDKLQCLSEVAVKVKELPPPLLAHVYSCHVEMNSLAVSVHLM